MNKRSDKIRWRIMFRKQMEALHELTYMPRWVIMVIDTIMVIVSYLFSYLLLGATQVKPAPTFPVEASLGIYTFAQILFFYLFRTHLGLIRHSSFLDAVKLFVTLLVGHSSLLVLNQVQIFAGGEPIFNSVLLVMSFLMSFMMLLIFRMMVKYMFDRIKGQTGRQILKRTVIFGVDHNAVALAEALVRETPQRFQLVGFIDKGMKAADKRIMNLPILSCTENLHESLQSLDAEVLVLADKNLNETEKFDIVEQCASKHIRLFMANLIADYENGDGQQKNIRNLKIEDLLQRPTIKLDAAHVAKSLYNKTILVTGGAGSIGSEIVAQLGMFNPRQVVIVDQAETPMYELELKIKAQFPNLKFVIRIGDVTDAMDMERIFAAFKPEIIYHAAAYKHVPMMEKNPIQAVMANVLGVRNIADLALRFESERFILVSTDKAVNPTNIMGATKKIAEIYTQSLYYSELENENTKVPKFITTRFGNVLGSNGSVVPLFQKQIERGGPVTLTHPEVTRFFMTIPEACQLVLQAGSLGEGGEVFLFDMGEPVKIYDLARKMIQLSGLVPNQDIEIKFVGLRPGEKLYEELYDNYAQTTSTTHQKILRVLDRVPKHHDVLGQLAMLMQAMQAGDSQGIIKHIKAMVPEYHKPDHTEISATQTQLNH